MSIAKHYKYEQHQEGLQYGVWRGYFDLIHEGSATNGLRQVYESGPQG